MQVDFTELNGVFILTPPAIFEDFRGHNIESFNKKVYEETIVVRDWVVDSISSSRKHVLRGIHGDDCTTKLVSCLYGSIYLVVLNNDPESPQYKQWASFTLSDANKKQVLIPPKFGNGHVVMSDHAVFSYKLDSYHNYNNQFTIRWNDEEAHNIWWPVKKPITSLRDA
tara:strand:+ start:111 stop:614 length:504 start_codon:yes stop_codon:yes gene_type:complete